MSRTSEPSKVVSIRVPESLPARVKAATGLSFSKAITQFFEAFVDSMTPKQEPSDADPTDTHDS